MYTRSLFLSLIVKMMVHTGAKNTFMYHKFNLIILKKSKVQKPITDFQFSRQRDKDMEAFRFSDFAAVCCNTRRDSFFKMVMD